MGKGIGCCDLGKGFERGLRRAVRDDVALGAVGGRENRRNLRMLVRKGSMVR